MVFFGHIGVTLGAVWLARAAARPWNAPNSRTSRVSEAVREGLDLRWLIVGSALRTS